MLTKLDKSVIRQISAYVSTHNTKGKQRDLIEKVIYQCRGRVSDALLKFLKIRCLLNPNYIIYKRYVKSIQYKNLLDEVLNVVANSHCCLTCKKPIRPNDNAQSGLSLFRVKQQYCSRNCASVALGKKAWELLYKDKEKYKKRMKRIRATMIKRYGAPTTLQSKALKEKALKTRWGADYVVK